jgi:hypothetical protein
MALKSVERSSQMMVRSGAVAASGMRRLSPIELSPDGCPGFDVRVREDVPTLDEGMIRRALLRSSLACENIDGLRHAINRQLWQIGYVAEVWSDPVDRSVVVEVSMSRC